MLYLDFAKPFASPTVSTVVQTCRLLTDVNQLFEFADDDGHKSYSQFRKSLTINAQT